MNEQGYSTGGVVYAPSQSIPSGQPSYYPRPMTQSSDSEGKSKGGSHIGTIILVIIVIILIAIVAFLAYETYRYHKLWQDAKRPISPTGPTGATGSTGATGGPVPTFAMAPAPNDTLAQPTMNRRSVAPRMTALNRNGARQVPAMAMMNGMNMPAWDGEALPTVDDMPTTSLESRVPLNAKDICMLNGYMVELSHMGQIALYKPDDCSNRTLIGNNIEINSIHNWMGHLFALGRDGFIHKLPSAFTNGAQSRHWNWSKWKHSKANVAHVSTTTDGSKLFAKAGNKGYLYDEAENLLSEFHMPNVVRNYGMDENHYVDIDRSRGTGTVTPTGERLTGIVDAAFNDMGGLVTLDKGEGYKRIRCIDGTVYLLK